MIFYGYFEETLIKSNQNIHKNYLILKIYLLLHVRITFHWCINNSRCRNFSSTCAFFVPTNTELFSQHFFSFLFYMIERIICDLIIRAWHCVTNKINGLNQNFYFWGSFQTQQQKRLLDYDPWKGLFLTLSFVMILIIFWYC